MASSNPPSGKKQPIDPLLQQRLSELGNRRGGAPLPPPQPGQQPAGRSGQQKSSNQSRPAAKQQPGKSAGASRVIDTTPDPRTPRTPPRSSQSSRPAPAARPGATPRPGTAPRPGKRVKPARSAKMAALAVSVASTAALAVYFANQGSPSQAITLTGGTLAGTANNGNTKTNTGNTTATTAAPSAGSGTTKTPTTTKKPTTTAAKTVQDGTYTGGVSQNRWGNVQVAAVYKGGKMVDVQVLQYPDSHDRSVAINQYALPILINDSLGSQSANINNISGATYTSQSYAQSLQSAIDAAKSASGITG
jgi:uncharacterized protein with FMN-binding domain